MAKYTALSELNREFNNGYLIVGSTLFEVDDGTIVDSTTLSKSTTPAMVAEARQIVGNRKRIYVDDDDYFDEELLLEEGKLCDYSDPFDDEDDDWNEERLEAAFGRFMDN